MTLAVREFFNNERHLHLQFVAGDGGLNRRIRSSEIVRPLAFFAAGIRAASAGPSSPGRKPSSGTKGLASGVLVVGQDEIAAFFAVPAKVRRSLLDRIRRASPSAIVFTDGLSPARVDPELLRQTAIPIFTTRLPYTRFLAAYHTFVENRLAPQTNVHGTFVTLFGLGVLLMGPSGIGKSEIALSLIERSHSLVADDTVQVRLEQDRDLIGSAPELGRHLMEIRGLGILNVRQLFGVAAVVDQHPIHLIVDLLPPVAGRREERLGGIRVKTILGVQIPRVIVQVRIGRHMAVIIEAAARNQQLRAIGYDTAWAFRQTLARRLLSKPS